MTDRELLERAAKAAGLNGGYFFRAGGNGFPYNIEGFQISGGAMWNPLQSDGDALRLAVKLNLSIVIDSEIGAVQVGRFDFENDIREEDAAKIPHYAATRRAIVRAAAAIGKEMP